MSITQTALMQQRRDTAANWTSANPTLLAGEIGIESDTNKIKLGTGSTSWTSLAYAPWSQVSTYPFVNADIASAAGIVDTKLATIATALKVSNSATTAASANTASAIVARDASGNFTAGTITAALTGAASSNVLKAGDTMTGALVVPLGAVGTPSLTFTGDLNTGIYSPGADQLAVATNGVARLTTSTTAVSSSLAIDHPLGAVGTPSITFTGDLNTGFYSPAADTLAAVTAGSNRLHITSGGLVGIGTSSPANALHVVGTSATSNTGATVLVDSSAALAADIGGSIAFRATDGATVRTLGLIRGGKTDLNSGTFDGYLAFETRANGVANTTERLRITNTGNVGIGTTSPSNNLHISGTGLVRANIESTSSNNADILFTTAGTLRGAMGYSSTVGGLSVDYGRGGGPLAFSFVGSEVARLDSSGRLLVGTSTSITALIAAGLQVQSTGANAYASIGRWDNNAANPGLILNKSRSGSVGTLGIVQSGDSLGELSFTGDDGSAFVYAARIQAQVDGTPGVNDMPGRLVFATTVDGASSLTEALRITNDRVIAYNQPTPTSKSAAATLTITELKTGIIQYTGAVATLTLPTGTLMEGGFSGIYTNMAFEWSVINTGAGICTVAAGTDHTVIGSGTVAIGASARFVSRRTAANTFVSYCLS